MHRIVIDNFGPITHVDLTFNRLNVLIGAQATGKSTIVKAVYFFISLRNDFLRFLVDAVEKNEPIQPKQHGEFGRIVRQKFLQYWGTTKHFHKDFKIEFFYGNNQSITLHCDHRGYLQANIHFFDKLLILCYRVNEFIKQEHLNAERDPILAASEKNAFYNGLMLPLDDWMAYNGTAIYVPAGRSLLATLSDSLLFLQKAINETNKNGNSLIDLTLQEFLERIGELKKRFNDDLSAMVELKRSVRGFNNPSATIYAKKAIALIDKILKARYRYEKGAENLRLLDEKGRETGFVKLSFASSGQQEAVWILLQIFALILDEKPVFLVIEEPEAHLYPEAQKSLIELICLLANYDERSQIVLTTHSPYILASLNNHIYAGKLAKNEAVDKAAIAQVLAPELWVSPYSVGAYTVANGQISSLQDEETQLIRAEEIDSASGLINEEFDQFFNLDN